MKEVSVTELEEHPKYVNVLLSAKLNMMYQPKNILSFSRLSSELTLFMKQRRGRPDYLQNWK